MCTRFIALILCLLCRFNPAAAQLSNQVWLTGYNEFPGASGYGQAMIRFQDVNVQVSPASLAFNLESTLAVAADAEGQLLFYSNGCAVSNRAHTVMPNGSGLNPGSLYEQVCPGKGYIVPQGAMALPMPGDSNRYYLIHLGAQYDPVRKLRLSPLYYTEIDMSLDNGMGDVVSKNNILVEADLGNFTVVRHANGRDWWILAPEFGNKKWYRWLLTPQGLQEQNPLVLSISSGPCEHYAQTAVSSDGSQIANWGDCRVAVFDFDRCAGALMPALNLYAPSHWVLGGGLAFSPTGRYLYATSHNVLFRANLDAAAPQLDTMRYSYDPYNVSPYYVPGNSFHYLLNGPDDKIYGCIPSRANRFQVINKPDGNAINNLDFKPEGIKMPGTNVRTMPYFANYRLRSLAGSPCDSLGIVSAKNPELGTGQVAVSPNPAVQKVIFEIQGIPDPGEKTLYIWNATGSLQTTRAGITENQPFTMDVSEYPTGLYYWSLILKNGAVFHGKLMVSNQ